MTRAETKKLLSFLGLLYPRLTVSEPMVEAWSTMLLDLDYEAATTAAKEHAAVSQWPPTIAEIRRCVAERSCTAPSTADAWDEVVRAFGTHGRDREPHWSHPAVATAVAGTGGWQNLCNSENQVADRAHFLRLYAEERLRTVHEANVRPLIASGNVDRALGQVTAGDAVRALMPHIGKGEPR